MCNDYRLMVELASVIEEFEHLKIKFPEGRPNIEAREDIKITDTAPIVRTIDGERGAAELVQRRWSWPSPIRKPVYNFRSEGREFSSNRCLIVADGFYEFMWTLWRVLTGGNDAACRSAKGELPI